MIFGIIWILVGVYFIYLGVEILFFRVTKRIGTLETHVYKNQKAFVFRVGLLELFFGILLVAGSVYAVINYNNVLFEYKLLGIDRQVGYNIIPLGLAIICVISIWLNQKFSEAKIEKKENDDSPNNENE